MVKYELWAQYKKFPTTFGYVYTNKYCRTWENAQKRAIKESKNTKKYYEVDVYKVLKNGSYKKVGHFRNGKQIYSKK